MSELPKLLPCPFCGEQPELIKRGNEHGKSRSAEVYCRPCHTIMKVGAIRQDLDWCATTVTNKWNRRVNP